MDFITGKHIPRRTFLRGMGASVALPFLDAMAPAGRPLVCGPSDVVDDPTRLVAIEMVHGAAGCNEWGATQNLCGRPPPGEATSISALPRSAAAGAVPGPPDDRQQHGRQDGRGGIRPRRSGAITSGPAPST